MINGWISHFMVVNFGRNRKQRIKMGLVYVKLSRTKLKYSHVPICLLSKFPFLVSSLKEGYHVLTLHYRYDGKIDRGTIAR